MSALPIPFTTPEQYLEAERKAEYKSEFYSGQMFAMAGASRRHNVIVGNVVRRLGNLLSGRPCETYPSDMKVLVQANGLYTYPDVTVVCGEPEFLDRQGDVLLNPQLIVEVLSDSTEAYDRGAKWRLYQELASLREYVLVSQSATRIERYARQGDGRWLYEAADGIEASVMLESLGIALPLSEVYERVAFAPGDAGTTGEEPMKAGGHI